MSSDSLSNSTPIHSSADCLVTTRDMDSAYAVIKGRLASTPFKGARLSEVCGLIRLEMDGGKTAYTDKTGKYFILGLVLDLDTGSPADGAAEFEKEISK